MLSHEESFLNVFVGEWTPYNAGCPGRGKPEPAPLLESMQPVLYSAAQLHSGGVASLQLVPELMYKSLHSCRKCKPQINSFSIYLKPV